MNAPIQKGMAIMLGVMLGVFLGCTDLEQEPFQVELQYPDGKLEDLGEERTRVSFEIDFNLMGKLGSLGYPMVKRKSGEISRQFAENLKEAAQGQA